MSRRFVLLALVVSDLGCNGRVRIFDWGIDEDDFPASSGVTASTTPASEGTTEGSAAASTDDTTGGSTETTGMTVDSTETAETITTTVHTTTTSDTDSTSSTTGSPCGNGVCEPEFEEDLSNCPDDCKCGNGVQDAGEDCDDGNDDNTDACVVGCQSAECGDGFIQGEVEECDDDNMTDGDGCSASCELPRRRVFVTSTPYKGNLGGLTGADDKCNMAAAGLQPPGTFKAWLSDNVTGPADRFDTSFSGYYVLLDGTKVALGWTGLTSGTLLQPIDLDESGNTGVKEPVWTNTDEKGEPRLASVHCNLWTDDTDSFSGAYGTSSASTSAWTKAGNENGDNCLSSNRLYCFENLD